MKYLIILLVFHDICTHIEHWEVLQDSAKLLVKCVLSKLDLAHVEVTNTTDFEVFVDDLRPCLVAMYQCADIDAYRRRLSLCFGEDNVQEIRRRGDGCNRLEPARRHLDLDRI